ncbi:NINE protein [Ectothiorhodospiraceae bacterium 2226]|nr:NINE protein [Ectothiorhodospiraceae bacterium 2226]
MSKAWKDIDLAGGGLQALNARLTRQMKRRPTAYAWWALFPLGAHRFYLNEPRGGAAYLALLALTLVGLLVAPVLALVPLALMVLFALYDLVWIDRRVVSFNKELRMAAFLGGGAAPPKGYRGRYVDEAADEVPADYVAEKERERAGVQPVKPQGHGNKPRMPSFAEQEAMLRDLAKQRGTKRDDKP